MSQTRPKLSNLRRVCPQDLAHCEGYVWHLGTKIGKGSFGEVYLGWTNDGNTEVAVKVVRKEFFKQDPKVRENLEREIRILKLLRGCEYVVQILHVQELRQCIVLVMELCDYDLDHLVKVEPFKEETIIVFLYQLAQGMKALRNQNIVHRDLKPGNILIKRHPTTKKMMIKLADFGFARHFKDEGNKAIDMTSLAGTPVFMAPEALSCVFHPGEHYDDKVDIWSIGALLYKVIVGQCGFYAQLQDIPRILKHKGDAIAFERAPNRKVNYIYELPPSVNDRLSESFRDGMKNLLCSMLKLDPRERMTFTEFFENVDDIIRSKIEIINLLHGTSFKIIADPTLTADVLIDKVHIQWHIASVSQVIFSTSCSHYISPNETFLQTQLVELLEKSGGSEGHAKLYLLPLNQLQQSDVPPDSTCFTALKYTVEDEVSIINLITEQKFSDEIVHMIGYMGAQQKKQLEGLEELDRFTSREIGTFKANVYPLLLEEVHQTLAKAALALQWLNDDMTNLDGQLDHGQLAPLIASLEQNRSQLQHHLQELAEFNTDCPKPPPSISKDEISKGIAALSERAKKLPRARKDQIQALCNNICKDSIGEISRVTQAVKTQLVPFSDVLTRVWSLGKKSSDIFKTCLTVNQVLVQALQERSIILKSLSAGTFTQDKKVQASSVNHLPVVTPPPAWPHPSVRGSYLPPTGQPWADPAVIDNLKRQVDSLNSQLATTSQENHKLKAEVLSLLPAGSTTNDVESTLIPGEVVKKGSIQQPGLDTKVMEGLAQKLQQFCVLAEKMNLPSAKVRSAHGGGGALYPNLLADYSVISMPSLEDSEVKKLLPMAVELSTTLSSNMKTLEKAVHKEMSTLTTDSALVKIGRPSEYERGDIVLFTAVKTVKSKSNIPALLHLQQIKPYVLLDASSYSSFNIRPGRTPELFFGKLLEAPRRMRFEDHRDTASEVGEESGEFFCVTAECVSLKFSAQRGFTSGTLDPALRPTRSPASPSGGSGQKFWKPFHKSHGSKPDRDFV